MQVHAWNHTRKRIIEIQNDKVKLIEENYGPFELSCAGRKLTMSFHILSFLYKSEMYLSDERPTLQAKKVTVHNFFSKKKQ